MNAIDTYSAEWHARRMQLRTRLQRAANRRWTESPRADLWDLTISAHGTLDPLARRDVVVVVDGKAKLSVFGRIALYDARHRRDGMSIDTSRRNTSGPVKLPTRFYDDPLYRLAKRDCDLAIQTFEMFEKVFGSKAA